MNYSKNILFSYIHNCIKNKKIIISFMCSYIILNFKFITEKKKIKINTYIRMYVYVK